MLVVVAAAATVIESRQEASLRLPLLAAATYTSNWYQILHHVSYFASALLIGAALALACPLQTLAAIPAAHTRRLDIGGVVGLAALAGAAGHLSGSDPVLYPAGLLLAALGAAALIAAAAGNGVIAAITSWWPLRWIGVRSYGI